MTSRPAGTRVHLLLGLAALALAHRGDAIELRQTALNNSGAARYGQKLLLQSGPTVTPPLGSAVFDNRTATLSGTTLTLYYRFVNATRTVAVNATADIYANLSGNSAIVKSWSWTNSSGTAVAACFPVSSSVSGAASLTSSALAPPGDEKDASYGGSLVSAYWTFYNGTDRPIYLPSLAFTYEERRRTNPGQPVQERAPADGRDNDIVTGGDFAGFFGGAQVIQVGTGRAVYLPPRGGVSCRVNPTEAPQDPNRQLFVVAQGKVSVNGTRNDTTFIHKNAVPESTGQAARSPLTSTYWRSYVGAYKNAQQTPTDPANQRLIALGDVLIGPAQVWMDQLLARYPALAPVSIVNLLTTPASSTDFARLSRVELAAFLLNRASGALHPDDKLSFSPMYRPLSLEGASDQLAKMIASGSATYQKQAHTTLAALNGRANPIYPYSAVISPPVAPTQLSVVQVAAGRVRLRWFDKSPDETCFRVERRKGSGAFTEVRVLPANTTGYEDVGLTVGITYTYRVRAFKTPDAFSGYTNPASVTPTLR